MKNNYPLVTVFTLIYNTNPKYVIQAIDSVRANNYPNLQHIIIDDCSPDPEPKRVVKEWIKNEGYSCEFYEHEVNLGVCKTLNHVLELAKGKYIFGCSDDVIMPKSITDKVAIFECNPMVGLIYTEVECINEKNEIIQNIYDSIKTESNEEVLEKLKYTNFIPVSTCIYSKEMLDELSGFDENMNFEDWDLFLRVSKSNWKIHYDSKVSAQYRIHANSMWKKKSPDNLITVIKLFHKHKLFQENASLLNYFDHFQSLRLKEKFKVLSFLFSNNQIRLGCIYFLANVKYVRIIRFKLFKMAFKG